MRQEGPRAAAPAEHGRALNVQFRGIALTPALMCPSRMVPLPNLPIPCRRQGYPTQKPASAAVPYPNSLICTAGYWKPDSEVKRNYRTSVKRWS